MISKVYENIKKFIKANYIVIITYIILFIICLFPLPYYIYVGGGIIDLDERITISDENKENGSFNLAYVREIKATIPTYLISYLMSWDRESVSSYKIDDAESQSDIWKREQMYLQQSIDNAVINAYKRANENIAIEKTLYKVLSIEKNADTTLQIGDSIAAINDTLITKYDDIKNIVSKSEIGDYLKLLVIRNDKEIICRARVNDNSSKKQMGVYLIKTIEYNVERDIDVHFQNHEGGSSGGFMLSLAIYNRLIPKDLTNKLKIVGTGTIDEDGNVGPIDGVKYKLKGAVSSKANLFFAPAGENYEEAIKEREKHHYKIEIVSVQTLDDAISYLESRV